MVTVRRARPADADAVAAFTDDTWDEFDGGDYLPEVFPEWIAGDDERQYTTVAESEREVVGCCQVVALSATEAWTQGMRVRPDHRGEGVARALDDACREWARDRGADVARNMVFGWNAQGLGAARRLGYRPRAEFRWVHPDPDDPAAGGQDGTVTVDADTAWSFWQDSDACRALAGLTLDPGESWALSMSTPERVTRAVGDDRVLTVGGDADPTLSALAWRTRVDERDEERTAVYGATAWDEGWGDALVDAIRRDAAAVDADAVRALVPETPRHVADAAATGARLGEHPDFVLEATLSA
jgi:GNAT superfamily N-acetyltransferase